MSVPPTSLRPGDEVADVEVVELLATGASTETWRGKRPDGSEVVVHSLRPGASDQARDHFLAAAGDLSAKLRQRPISGLMPTAEVDPLAGAYVGEAVALGTMADLPALEWTPDEQLEFMRQLCVGLQALHTAGMVHGCLEPEIVVLDGLQRPVLANAGLVDIAAICRESPDLAELHRSYAAPEVRAGKWATARSDVFSVGRMLHFMLRGEPPDEPDEPIPRLDSLRGASPGLVRIVRKATALDPKDRYPECGALLADLHRYARGEPTGIGHPEVDDAARFAEAGGKLSQVRPSARPHSAKRARMPVRHDAPGRPQEPASSKPADRAKRPHFTALQWSARKAALFAALGLGGVGAATAVGYATGQSPLAAQLVGLLAGACLGLAVPGRGPSPGLVRALCVAIGLGLVGMVDPTAIGANVKKSRSGLRGDTVSERAAALAAARKAGNTQFPRVDLQQAELGGLDLSDVVLDGSSLREASCKRTNFRNASLINVDVTGADFSGATLDGVMPGFMVGWRESRCDGTTLMPAGWSCQDGRPTATKTGRP